MSNKPDLLVIGLGAMGAATTYQLAHRGANVVGIDKFAPPHEQGSTHGETRITRLAIGEGPQFVPLAQRSQQIWREIENESGDSIFNQCGGLIFARAGQSSRLHGQRDFLRATMNAAEDFDISHEIFDADSIAARFPQFELVGDERGYFEPEAGYLNPEIGVGAQLKLAGKYGARLITGHAAAMRAEDNRTVVECAGVEYRPGKTIVADRCMGSAAAAPVDPA